MTTNRGEQQLPIDTVEVSFDIDVEHPVVPPAALTGYSRRRRDRDVQAVVLADAEHIKTGLVGELCGGKNLGVTLSNADRAAGVRIGGNVAESVDA